MATSRLCSIPECGKPTKGRGFCHGHYHRLMRYGDPMEGGAFRQHLPDRCSVPGCGKPPAAKGFCQTHYYRHKTYGDPLGGEFYADNSGECSIEWCDRSARERGLCGMHYHRYLRHGDPLAGGTYHGDPMRWLHDHLDYKGFGCLAWPFWINTHGYGYLTIDRNNVAAATVMAKMKHGPKPTPAHESAHSCGRGHEGCVHPDHIRWATRAENSADRLLHGTDHRGEKHPRSFLTEADVIRIRSLRMTLPQVEIAEMFGISKSHVSLIHLGKRWACLD